MSETLLLAKELLSRASVTPEDNGCQPLIAELLSGLGFEIHFMNINKVNNLWAIRRRDAPVLCFAGHTDVVPVGELSQWQTPPFEPTIRAGKLYARGAADMKSSIAAMITACQRLLTQHPNYPGSLAFLITSDEEGLAEDGTQAVLKLLQAQQAIPRWCLVGEASSEKKLGDVIKVGRRGSLTGHLTIKGIQGHVAYPQLAKNPIHLAFASLDSIAKTIWDEGKLPFPPTTLQFANIHAGTGANNVIPGALQTNFNLRFSPAITAEEIKSKICAILDAGQFDYEITWHLSGKPFLTDAKSNLIKVVNDTIQTELGYAPQHSTSGGTSDGRFFAEYGSEVVELGPNNASIHQINEWIMVDELEQLSHLYEKILQNIVK